MNPSHKYFSSLLLIVVYGLPELHTVSMHLVIGCFNFHGRVPDSCKYLTCITSFVVEFHQSVPQEPFLPSFEHLVNFFVLWKKEATAFPYPPVPVIQFHKPLLIIASAARGPDLVVLTWSLFLTHLPCSSLSMSPSSQILSERAELELLTIFHLSVNHRYMQ